MTDLQQLRYFAAVAQFSHFTKAAAALNVAQPHVSREIHRLERELGVMLFERTTRQVRLTPAGAEFLGHTHRIFSQLEEGKARARAVGDGRVGALVAAFPGSVTYSWLPFLAKEFRKRYPEVDLVIKSEVLTGAQVDGMRAGTIDVGLLRPPVPLDVVEVFTLDNEPLIAALPSAHPLAVRARPVEVAMLEREPFIAYRGSGANTTKVVLKTCLDAGFEPSIVQSVADTHSLVSLVAAGMGVALAPRSIYHFTVPGVRYLPLAEDAVLLPLLLAWRRDPERATTRTFVSLVRELSGSCEWPGRNLDLPWG